MSLTAADPASLAPSPPGFLAFVQRMRRRPCWDIGDQSSTSSEPIGNSRANYFFRPAIYVIKMVPRFELPRFNTEAANHCQLFVASSLAKLFFTNYTLSTNVRKYSYARTPTSESLTRSTGSSRVHRSASTHCCL
jgi:hypothetical protein